MFRMPSVQPIATTLDPAIKSAINGKTKPLGSLGKLETLAFQIARVQQTLTPVLVQPSCIIFAGDHGLTAEGISAYPSEVTAQMVINFMNGGAAINAFCNQHNIELSVVDAAVQQHNFTNWLPNTRKVMNGTNNAKITCAMNERELQACFEHGFDEVLSKEDTNLFIFGEMGIGNTASAALIMALLTDISIEKCTGRGTGLDDLGLRHKISILSETCTRHKKYAGDPLKTLMAVGGCEINMMCGAAIQAAALGKLILVDGFIATAAILAASKIEPNILEYCVFAHQSDEQGHKLMLEHLRADPLLQLGLRLGEGSGAAIAYPLLESAVRFLNEMATFESAQISDSTS